MLDPCLAKVGSVWNLVHSSQLSAGLGHLFSALRSYLCRAIGQDGKLSKTMQPPISLTRLVQALKGESRFANPKARIIVSTATTRDMLIETGIGNTGSVMGQASGHSTQPSMSLIDPNGNPYAMLNLVGFGDGATLT
jgi:hypothetical protein